ncbi:MAG: hypothetical protein ACQESK_02475 [Bacteroidota bacterium]
MKLEIKRHGLLGIAIFLMVLILFLDKIEFYLKADRAEGEVIGYTFEKVNFTPSKFSKTGGEVKFNRPIFEFKINNFSYQSEGQRSSYKFFEKGDDIEVLYIESENKAYINSFLEYWFPVRYIEFILPIFVVILVLIYGVLDKGDSITLYFKSFEKSKPHPFSSIDFNFKRLNSKE